MSVVSFITGYYQQPWLMMNIITAKGGSVWAINAHTLPQKDNEGQLRKLESRDALQVSIRKGEERGHLCQALSCRKEGKTKNAHPGHEQHYCEEVLLNFVLATDR